MNIKAVLFFFIILLGLVLGMGEDPKGQKRKWYVIIIITLLILESSLRSVSVGPDTRGYLSDFIRTKYLTWTDVFLSFKIAYIEGEEKDIGFWVFVKLFQIISMDFNMFLFVCALVFFVPLGIILYRYSSHVLQLVFAFSLYVALFNIVALSGVRQQIATGFTFMAFLQLGKKHYWKAILIIAFGSLIHISSLIFLLVPFCNVVLFRKIKTIHLFLFAAIPFIVAFSGTIMSFLASFLANDYYASYGKYEVSGGVYTYVVLMELLSLFCYVGIKKDVVLNDFIWGLFYTMLPLVTVTAPLISLNGAMIRIGQYFTLYMMLLVPKAIDSMFFYANRKIIYFSLIAILVFLSLKTNFHYYFFWQEPQI